MGSRNESLLTRESVDMARVRIPVSHLEFDEGGNTVMVQSKTGTVLKVRLPVKIRTKQCDDVTQASHMDVNVSMEHYAGPVPPTFYLGSDARR